MCKHELEGYDTWVRRVHGQFDTRGFGERARPSVATRHLLIADAPASGREWYATYAPHVEMFASGGPSQVNLATTTNIDGGSGSFGYPAGGPTGALPVSGTSAGAHLSDSSTEFVNVLILIDSTQVNRYSLGAIADYVAMLVLTRTSLRGCSELPSVVDLLSPDCGTRAKPDGITATDTAYLKALYAARLDLKGSLVRAEISERMLREFLDR